jgi:ferredoxin
MSPQADEQGPRVVIAQTDIVFACRPGQPILDAAHEQGVALPYACRRGICGLCAADLVAGEVMPVDAGPMTNAQCRAGQVLLCRCAPASGTITLRPASWERRDPPRRLPPL